MRPRRHRRPLDSTLALTCFAVVAAASWSGCQGQAVMTEAPRAAAGASPRGASAGLSSQPELAHGTPLKRAQPAGPPRVWPDEVPAVGARVNLSEQAWREKLSEEAFHVLRESGTERAGTGELLKVDAPGIYHCAGCNAPLFSSEAKFDSGTGWPSYFQPVEPGRVGERVDRAYGMKRVEVYCLTCDGHLGHVFDDGPEPTGLRYCINSAAMDFSPGLPPLADASATASDAGEAERVTALEASE